MSDEEQIRQLFARYCHLVDDHQYEDWASLFAPDGTFETGRSGVMTGREDILAYIVGSHGSRRDRETKHICFNSEIDVSGETAGALSDYFVYVLTDNQPWAISSAGQNHDRLVRIEGQWRFASRRNVSLRGVR